MAAARKEQLLGEDQQISLPMAAAKREELPREG